MNSSVELISIRLRGVKIVKLLESRQRKRITHIDRAEEIIYEDDGDEYIAKFFLYS